MDRPLPTKTLELPLDTDEEHPRRLLRIGSSVVAYGGDDGHVVLLDGTTPRAFRRFDDDCLRAIGVSDDGQRVVVGSDSGMIQIYKFDSDAVEGAVHPFIRNGPSHNETASDDNDKEDDLFMSQSDALQAVYTGETVFPGPCYEAPIRDIQFLPNSHHAVIATETTLTIVNLDSPRSITEHVQELETSVGVRGVSMTPVADHDDAWILSALDMNGRLTHYNVNLTNNVVSFQVMEKEARLCVEKRDVGEMLAASPACRSSRPMWFTTSAHKKVLAVGGQVYLQLRVLDHNTSTLKEQDQPLSIVNPDTDGVHGHLESIVLVTSLGDDYLVSAGRDKRFVLWRLEARSDGSLQAQFVRQLGGECEAVPTDLMWHTTDDDKTACLYAVLANSKLVVMEGRANIIPKSTNKMIADGAMKADANKASSSKTVQPNGGDDEDDDDSVVFDSPAKGGHESDSSPMPKNRFVDDEADDGANDFDDVSVPARAVDSPGNGSRGGDDDDDEGSEAASDFDVEQYRLGSYRAPVQQPTLKLPDPQPAFAPSSTPLGMARRFLCWNHLGSVTHIQGVPGVSRSSIDIDFTDTLTRRPINFTDNIGFILGSMGEDGAIFATDLAEDDDDEDNNLDDVIDGLRMSETTKAALKKSQQKRMKKDGSKSTGSTIYFHRFDTFAAVRDKDWYLTLPDGERALGCACGEGWAAVMTSRRFLRLFTSGGNQGQVIWLPGDAVSMVGRGRFLAVFYHEAPPLMDETQKIGCMLFDATSNRTIHRGMTACISTGSCLAWAGFTNEGSLVAMDSDGMLSMLASSAVDETPNGLSWEWFPMLDTVGLRKSIDDSFWPITVYDGKLVCVPLKGGMKHPDATRRPVTTTLGLRLPLARGTLTAVNALEELSIRADIAFNQKKMVNLLQGEEDDHVENELRTISAQLDKVTLKMFAAVVEAGKLERALDLVDRLHLEKSFDLAMKIADHHHKLVDLIEEAKERRFGGQDDEEDDDDDDDKDQDLSGDEGYSNTRGPDLDRQRITPDAAESRKAKRAFDDIDAVGLPGGARQVRSRGAFA